MDEDLRNLTQILGGIDHELNRQVHPKMLAVYTALSREEWDTAIARLDELGEIAVVLGTKVAVLMERIDQAKVYAEGRVHGSR